MVIIEDKLRSGMKTQEETGRSEGILTRGGLTTTGSTFLFSLSLSVLVTGREKTHSPYIDFFNIADNTMSLSYRQSVLIPTWVSANAILSSLSNSY